MAKVVYNTRYGGFGLSQRALDLYHSLGGEAEDDFEIDREDPILVRVVEQLGSEAASGPCSFLRIKDLPDGTSYVIDEHDGRESLQLRDTTKWRVSGQPPSREEPTIDDIEVAEGAGATKVAADQAQRRAV